MTKIEKAQESCEQVLNGIEDGTITTTSALLQCLKIARLMNDTDAIMWFQYEYGGYPQTEDGKHIQNQAWAIGYKMGRGYIEKGKKFIFTELAPELEQKIVAQQSSVKNFTTQGTSVAGDYAAIAVNNLTAAVDNSTSIIVNNIGIAEKRLSILKAKYYDYALKKQIEISFGNVATTVFGEYREKVENEFSKLSKETLLLATFVNPKTILQTPINYRVDEGMNPRVLEKDQLIKLCNILAEEILIGKYDPEIGTYRIENNISDGRDSSITDDHLIAYRLCKEEIMYNWVQYLRLLIKNHFAFAGTMYNEDNLFQQRIPDQLWENIRTFIINLKNLPVWKDRSMAATIFGGKNKYDFWKIIFQTGKTSDGTQVLVVPLNVADMIKK